MGTKCPCANPPGSSQSFKPIRRPIPQKPKDDTSKKTSMQNVSRKQYFEQKNYSNSSFGSTFMQPKVLPGYLPGAKMRK
jgi:hypothetical protein